MWQEELEHLLKLDDDFWLEHSLLTDGWAFAGHLVNDNPSAPSTATQIDRRIDAEMEARQERLQALLDRHPDDADVIRARWKAHWDALRETCRPRAKGPQ